MRNVTSVSVTIKRITSLVNNPFNTVVKLTGAAQIFTDDNNIIGQKTPPGIRVGDKLTDEQVDKICERYDTTVTT